MEQQTLHQSTFPELSTALIEGYIHDFVLKADGLLYCHSTPGKSYDLHEISIIPVNSSSQKATLYLIQTNEGLRGTLVEYLEY